MNTQFAVPRFDCVISALVISLEEPFCVVIFLTGPTEINWPAVREMERDPWKIATTDIAKNVGYVYRGCDYTIGALMGLGELLTGKRFEKSPIPVEFPCEFDFHVQAYEFL